MSEKVQETLAAISEENLQALVVIGVQDDGRIVIRSSENNVAVMHWMLNRAAFELNVFETNNKAPAEEAA